MNTNNSLLDQFFDPYVQQNNINNNNNNNNNNNSNIINFNHSTSNNLIFTSPPTNNHNLLNPSTQGKIQQTNLNLSDEDLFNLDLFNTLNLNDKKSLNLIDLENQQKLLHHKQITNNVNNNNNSELNRILVGGNRKEEFYIEKFTEHINRLGDTSLILEHGENEKEINRTKTIELFNMLWRHKDDNKVVQEYCPCGSLCSVMVSNKYTDLNLSVSEKLLEQIMENHNYNSDFINSIFNHTCNKLSLVFYLLQHLNSQTMKESPKETVKMVKLIIEHILVIYKDEKLPEVLQELFGHFTSYLNNFVSNNSNNKKSGNNSSNNQQSHILDDIDEIDELLGTYNNSNNYELHNLIEEIQRFLTKLNHTTDSKHLTSAYYFMCPSREDIFEKDWLLNLFKVEPVKDNQPVRIPIYTDLNEKSLCSLIKQLNFKEFLQYNSSSNVNNNWNDKVLVPLRNLLNFSIIKDYKGLMILVSKVIAYVSHASPKEIGNSLKIVYKAYWPSLLLSTLLSNHFNWESEYLNISDMSNVFVDLFSIQFNPDVYSTYPEEYKGECRKNVITNMIKYQNLVEDFYSRDTEIANANSRCKYPQLAILTKLAILSASKQQNQQQLIYDGGLVYDLSRTIFDEMFCMAFVVKPRDLVSLGPQDNLNFKWPQFRSEVFCQLLILCQTLPHLCNRFCFNLSVYLFRVDIESLNIFIDPKGIKNPFYFWDMRGDGIHWLSFILSQRRLPYYTDNEFLSVTENKVGPIIYNLLTQPINQENQFPIHLYQPIQTFILKLVHTINWEIVTPISKSKMLIGLIGSRIVPYFIQSLPMILNSSKLLQNNCTMIINEILKYRPNSIYQPGDPFIFHYITIILKLHLISNENNITQDSLESLKLIILNTQDLIPKRLDLASSILCNLVYILRNNIFLLNELNVKVIFNKITEGRKEISENINSLIMFLKPWFTISNGILDQDTFPQYLFAWIHLLKEHLIDDDSQIILNYLISGVMFKNLYVNEIIGIFAKLPKEKLPIKQLLHVMVRRPYVCLLVAIGYHSKDTNMSHRIHEFKSYASLFNANPIGLFYWEQYFINCKSMNISSSQKNDTKVPTNDLLDSIMRNKNIPLLPLMKKSFENFMTWDYDQIFPYDNHRRLIHHDNFELMEHLMKSGIWVFNEPISIQQKSKSNDQQKQWLLKVSKQLSIDLIHSSLISNHNNINNTNNNLLVDVNIDSNNNNLIDESSLLQFNDIIFKTKSELNSNNQLFKNPKELSVFKEINSLIQSGRNEIANTLSLDKRIYEKSIEIYRNETYHQSSLVKCTYISCIGNTVTYDCKKSHFQNHIKLEIEQIKKEHANQLNQLIQNTLRLANLISIIKDSAFIQLFTNRQSKIQLFKYLIAMSSFDDLQDEMVRVVVPHLRDILIKIGKEILYENPSDYQFLVDVFLSSDDGLLSDNDLLIKSKDISIFAELFDPSKITSINQYMELLQKALKQFTSKNSSSDIKKILTAFKLESYLPSIFNLPDGKSISYHLIVYLLQIPSLIKEIGIVSGYLIRMEPLVLANEIIRLIVKNFCTIEICNIITGPQSELAKQISQMDGSTQQTLFNQIFITLSQDYPISTLPIENLSVSRVYILYSLVNLIKQLQPNILSNYFGYFKTTLSDSLKVGIKNSNNESRPMTMDEFNFHIQLFNSLVDQEFIFINLFWDLLYGLFISSEEMQQKQKEQVISELRKFLFQMANTGLLSQCSFHSSVIVIEQMYSILVTSPYGDLITKLFPLLNWSSVYSSNDNNIVQDEIILNYFKLSMAFCIITQSDIQAPELGLSFGSENSIDWLTCPKQLIDATVIFDGKTFESILLSPILKQDPTSQILNCLSLFNNITFGIDSFSMGTAFALEIRNLLYLVIQDSTSKKFWYLSYSNQQTLVQNYLLPLVRSLADNKDVQNSFEQSGKFLSLQTIIKTVLDCFNCDIKIIKSNQTSRKIPFALLEGYDELKSPTTIENLLYQFSNSCSLNVSIQIMKCSHLILSGTICRRVINNALRCFLTRGDTNISIILSKYLIIPSNEENMIRNSIKEGCLLTAYVLVEQFAKFDKNQLNEFLDAITTIDIQQLKDPIELWIMWILVIKLVVNDSLNLKDKSTFNKLDNIRIWVKSHDGSQKSDMVLKKLLGNTVGSTKISIINQQTNIAARTCSYFLQRSIHQKTDSKLIKEKLPSRDYLFDSMSSTEKINLKFFEELQPFIDNSTVLDTDELAETLVNHLAPYAKYILNLLKYDPQ